MCAGRKVLQDIANTLPQMFVGWRMQEDLHALARLPDGTLELDLLLEVARHDSVPCPALHLTGELAAWLRNRLASESIALPDVTKAELVVGFRTVRVATKRKSMITFDFTCTSTVALGGRTYRGLLSEQHSWQRKTDGLLPFPGPDPEP